MAKTRALLMLSGGIDSTYCMYQALSAGRKLVVHHVDLRTKEGRADAENRAVNQILRWFRAKGLTGFEYSSSTIDYSTFQHIPRDYFSYSYMAGMILANPRHRDVKSLIHARHKDAFNLRAGQTFESASRRANGALTGIPKLITGRDIKIELPIEHLLKKEVIAACPPDLLRLTWHCRRPRKSGAVFYPCHSCFTCVQVNTAGGVKRSTATGGRRSVRARQPVPRVGAVARSTSPRRP